jgi:hypothetical protein
MAAIKHVMGERQKVGNLIKQNKEKEAKIEEQENNVIV